MALPPVRNDRRAAEETFQALPALVITLVVVGLVFGALGAAQAGARAAEEGRRAQLQADLFLEAIAAEFPLRAPGDAIDWQGALAISAGQSALSFVPPRACVATVLNTAAHVELFLYGSVGSVAPGCVVSARPVPVLLENGTVVPGLLRAGVRPA